MKGAAGLSGVSGIPARFRRVGAAIGRLGGFSLSTILLAIASVISMPVMVAADGPDAWGSIALGQAIGAVAALIVGYGWAVSGPAEVARGDDAQRRTEYFDSIRVKLILFLPIAAGATLIAVCIARDHNLFAAAGALSASAIALSGNWYFAGLSRPYMWLCLETLPRIGGFAMGITLMSSGHSAVTGLACNTGGMFIAFVLITGWVHRSTASAARSRPVRKLSEILDSRRHGLASIVGSQIFLSAPLVIVSLVAPSTQPVFALIDKVRQLVSAGLNPVVAFLQGWVPRGARQMHIERGRKALVSTAVFSILFSAAFYVAAPELLRWLGNDQIHAPRLLIALTAVMIGLGVLDSVLAYAVLAAQGQLRLAARATGLSIVVMIPLVTAGAIYFGEAGALIGALASLLCRMGIELRGADLRSASSATGANKQDHEHAS